MWCWHIVELWVEVFHHCNLNRSYILWNHFRWLRLPPWWSFLFGWQYSIKLIEMICIEFKDQIRFLHLLFLVLVIKVGKEIAISFYIMTMRWLGSLGIASFYFIFYEHLVWPASLNLFLSISYRGFGNRKEFKVLCGNVLFYGIVVLFASVWLLVHVFF